jgi:hypothetical protein
MRLAQAGRLSLPRWGQSASFSPKSANAFAAETQSWSAAEADFGK